MYELHLKGKTIVELKKAVEDAAAELNGFSGTTRNVHVEKSVYSDTVKEAEDLTTDDDNYVDESEIGAGLKTSMGTYGGTEVDAEGLPWDSRIHASSRTTIANGTWKLKKGVDKDLVNKIKIELRGSASQTPAAPPIAPTISHVEVPPTNVVPMTQPVQQAPVVQQQQSVAPVQTPSMAASAPMPSFQNGHTVDTFRSTFAQTISQLITEGKISQDYVNQLCAHFGVDAIWKVSDENKAEIFESFVQYNLIKKVG